MRLVILTGASGAGKTTIARKLIQKYPEVQCFFFDSIGVPPVDRMIEECGSGEGWQRGKTIDWIVKIKEQKLAGPVLFEGQTRIAFIEEALMINGIQNAEIILIDCTDACRDKRLRGPRAQAELSNPQMMNWARYLREEALSAGLCILDTTESDLDLSVDLLIKKFDL